MKMLDSYSPKELYENTFRLVSITGIYINNVNVTLDTTDDLIDGDHNSCVQLPGTLPGCTKQDQVKINKDLKNPMLFFSSCRV